MASKSSLKRFIKELFLLGYSEVSVPGLAVAKEGEPVSLRVGVEFLR